MAQGQGYIKTLLSGLAFQVFRGPGPGRVLPLERAGFGQPTPAELTLYGTAVILSQAPSCLVPLPGYSQRCQCLPCLPRDVFYHTHAVTSVHVCAAARIHTHTFLLPCPRRRPCTTRRDLQSSVLSCRVHPPRDVPGFLLCPPAPPASLSAELG